MPIICPAILAEEPHAFREQMERVAPFAQRVQIDLTDGEFAPSRTVNIENVWWLKTVIADLHLMYKKPALVLDKAISLQPHMIILHAESEGDFVDMAEKLRDHHIKAGVALLPETEVSDIEPSLSVIDHVMIFSGDLGRFGGQPDMTLLKKVKSLKKLKPELEIGWDGGVTTKNIKQLVDGGIDVLNVGGFIQHANNPEQAYGKLVTVLEA
ncbi:MAG: hypothetical protein U5K77_03950 [Candidatus Saccharibacteria bacterium]|nr:hypothetical protein [Candidatus Saccharibacteria bacterium]